MRRQAAVGSLFLAAVGCTGDASLGHERAPLQDATPLLRDAGTSKQSKPTLADATPPPSSPHAGAAPLVLEFRMSDAGVTELNVACPDGCFSLELAARGGVPPYSFSWDDANTDAQRTLCADSDRKLSASVQDAEGGSSTAAIAIKVDECDVGALCANNPSFEGAPTFGAAWLRDDPLAAKPWDDCRETNPEARTLPKIVGGSSGDDFPDPSAGASYLYLESAPASQRAVSQMLCAPMRVGSVYSFEIDLAGAAENNLGAPLSSVQVEILGSQSICQPGESLWISPRLDTGWRTFCVTLKPSQDASVLNISAFGPGPEASAVFVDHLVPVDSCP